MPPSDKLSHLLRSLTDDAWSRVQVIVSGSVTINIMPERGAMHEPFMKRRAGEAGPAPAEKPGPEEADKPA